MSLATVIQKPVIHPRYTATVTGRKQIVGWLVYSVDAFNVASSITFTAMTFNATPLTLRANIGLVEANDGSWFQATDGTVYVNPPTGQSIYSATIRGTVIYYFSSEPVILDSVYYEPRLLTTPSLSMRIDARFGGVGQIGSGTCSLANGDGWFDDKTDIRWESVQFKVGADTVQTVMSSGDYVAFGFWKVQGVRRNDNDLTLTLIEPKSILESKIPLETYTRSAYPIIDEKLLGKPIPRAYGRCFGVTPICTDAASKTFKVAGHAIYEFSEVRILQDNVWNQIAFTTTDTATATFTLGAAWADNEPLSVDIIGRKRADGTPMYNASEIVQDILEYIGESNFDTAAFDAAFDSLDVGYYPGGVRNTMCKPSLYLDSSAPALDAIAKINALAGSFLYITGDGEWHYEVFEPKQLADVAATFADDSIMSGVSMMEEARDVFSKVNVRFGDRFAEAWNEISTSEATENQYNASAGAAIVKDFDLQLGFASDADYIGQRSLTTDGRPLRKYTLEVLWSGVLLTPGDHVAISFAALSLYGVFEVLEANHSPDSNTVKLTVGDRRAWGDSFGWWVADSVAAWDETDTDTEKREASEASGYWHGDDDLADATDSEAHKISRWW